MPQDEKLTWNMMLQRYLDKEPKKETSKEIEEEVTKEFLENYSQSIQAEKKADLKIPRFFYKKPTNFSDSYLAVRAEAKQKFLITQSLNLPQKKDLKELWFSLKGNKSGPNVEDIERINYQERKRKCTHHAYYRR